LQKAKQGIPV